MEEGNGAEEPNFPVLGYSSQHGTPGPNFHCEGIFALYVESLKTLVPHHNYAHWIPVHIRDMESLSIPILQEFEEHSHWVTRKTMNRFSTIPIDQVHEQNNEVVKGSGGAVSWTENHSPLEMDGRRA